MAPVVAAVNQQINGCFTARARTTGAPGSACGDGETVVTVVTAGVAVVADVGLVGAGVGDGVLETGASVGAGNVAVDPDAASGKGATATGGKRWLVPRELVCPLESILR